MVSHSATSRIEQGLNSANLADAQQSPSQHLHQPLITKPSYAACLTRSLAYAPNNPLLRLGLGTTYAHIPPGIGLGFRLAIDSNP